MVTRFTTAVVIGIPALATALKEADLFSSVVDAPIGEGLPKVLATSLRGTSPETVICILSDVHEGAEELAKRLERVGHQSVILTTTDTESASISAIPVSTDDIVNDVIIKLLQLPIMGEPPYFLPSDAGEVPLFSPEGTAVDNPNPVVDAPEILSIERRDPADEQKSALAVSEDADEPMSHTNVGSFESPPPPPRRGGRRRIAAEESIDKSVSGRAAVPGGDPPPPSWALQLQDADNPEMAGRVATLTAAIEEDEDPGDFLTLSQDTSADFQFTDDIFEPAPDNGSHPSWVNEIAGRVTENTETIGDRVALQADSDYQLNSHPRSRDGAKSDFHIEQKATDPVTSSNDSPNTESSGEQGSSSWEDALDGSEVESIATDETAEDQNGVDSPSWEESISEEAAMPPISPPSWNLAAETSTEGPQDESSVEPEESESSAPSLDDMSGLADLDLPALDELPKPDWMMPAPEPLWDYDTDSSSYPPVRRLNVGERIKVIAFTVPKGGTGKTATSANTASLLASLGKRVLYVDANAQQADGADTFDTATTAQTIVELAVDAEHITRESVHRVLTPIPGMADLYCLFGPRDPRLANPKIITPQLYSDALDAVVDEFDYVIIDSPIAEAYRDIIEAFILTKSDYIVNVVTPSWPTVTNTFKWLTAKTDPAFAGERTYPSEQVGYFFNRYETDVEFGEEAALETLGQWRFLGRIPDLKSVRRATNQGIIPNDPKYIGALAEVIYEVTKEEALRPMFTSSNTRSRFRFSH